MTDALTDEQLAAWRKVNEDGWTLSHERQAALLGEVARLRGEVQEVTNQRDGWASRMMEFAAAEAKIAAVEVERDAAQSLIGDLRDILSRPGKRVAGAVDKLTRYKGDLELRERQWKARGAHNPHAGIVKTFSALTTTGQEADRG